MFGGLEYCAPVNIPRFLRIMAHIALSNSLPGIAGLLAHRPDTAKPLSLLAETILRGPSTLTTAERELIATHVSRLNDCHFCACSHQAAAMHLAGEDRAVVWSALLDPESAPIDEKMKALLAIAGKVQKGGKHVTESDVERARNAGATDDELHDAVLVAAAFCMYNRYVDGMATWAPQNQEDYEPMGARLATEGYIRSR
jgi:uncharacterized peroxidase-related enzyme